MQCSFVYAVGSLHSSKGNKSIHIQSHAEIFRNESEMFCKDSGTHESASVLVTVESCHKETCHEGDIGSVTAQTASSSFKFLGMGSSMRGDTTRNIKIIGLFETPPLVFGTP